MTKLKDINTTDICDSIKLGCQKKSNPFNADEAHHPGRHLNALLNRGFTDS